MTTQERIDNLKQQQEQHREMFLKCAGAIEMLQQMLEEENKTEDNGDNKED